MKILFVGPGAMEIPSKGWGAVETVIWQLKLHLEEAGAQVSILNTRGIAAALKAKPWKYDLVHLQYDNFGLLWILLAKIYKFKLVITSHYGYAAWPEKWHWSYWKIFWALKHAPALIVLSPEIEAVYRTHGYKGFIKTIPNGTEIGAISFNPTGTKDLICLGKVEPRKKQVELSHLFAEQKDIHLDFVGPIVDTRFVKETTGTHYLGTWTREEVRSKLTEYKALILLSDGEAHALVVGEALAAGLSLILTKEAAANLDLNQPFIRIVTLQDPILTIAQHVCSENAQYRKQIRDYVTKQFDWKHIVQHYLTTAQEIKIYYEHKK